MNVNQEMHIASVSKTITAVAVIQLLKENDLSITSKIGPWLPAYWNAKQAIKDLTFQELMTHSSGLAEASNSWDSLKATVARGLDNPAKPAGVYANINYGIFRGIIPYLIDKTAAIAKDNGLSDAAFETWLTNQYLDYVQDNIFTPIGLNNVTCTPTANTAMGYNECNGGNGVCGLVSMTPGDLKDAIGGVGFFMSAMEVARFMVYLSHTYTLLDAGERSMMDNKMLGWDVSQSPMTEMGPSYGKNGAWYSDVNGIQGNNAGDPGMQTLVMKFPAGIELTVFVNSIPGPWRNLSSIARNAYNNAWDEVE
jgi:D-alanyl-D-alanine carboxypeptidase